MRELTFAPEGEFSWAKAGARTLGLWSLSYAALAVILLAAGAELIDGRGSTGPIDPGYVLIIWVGLQGFYPVFLRATTSQDELRPQSPRFLRLLLMSQVTGLVLLAVLLTPLARIQAVDHPGGSLVAEIPHDPRAWLAFFGYALGMLAWPVAAGMFMMRMTARWRTLVVGAAIGVPLFLLALIGGLLLGALRMLDPAADLASLQTLFGVFGLSGAVVYVLVLLWYRASVAREPLGPPPDQVWLFGAAVTATGPRPGSDQSTQHPPDQPPLTYQPHQTYQAHHTAAPGPRVSTAPVRWGSFLLGALAVWLVLWTLATALLWVVGLSGPAGGESASEGLVAIVVMVIILAGPLGLVAVHRPGTGLRLGHRSLHRATWVSLGVGSGVLLPALPLWALLGLLPETWWRPPLGSPVLDAVIAVLFLVGTTFAVHAGILLIRRGEALGAPRPGARILGWVLVAVTVLTTLLFASIWLDGVVAADDSLRLGIGLFVGVGAVIGWLVHLLCSRVPAAQTSAPTGYGPTGYAPPPNGPYDGHPGDHTHPGRPSSAPTNDHIRSDIDVTGTTYPNPYRSEPPRRHP